MSGLVPHTFEGRDLRSFTRDGDISFIAGDAASFLGYRDAANLTRTLDADEKGTHNLSTPGGPQQVAIITEAGLYRAIAQRRDVSSLPAETREFIARFQRWLFHEVLPTIRRTGSYAPPAVPAPAGLSREALDMIRRIDGIARMLSAKITAMESRLDSRGEAVVPAVPDFGGTVSAYQIIEMAGIPVEERQRGTAQMVTRRLVAFCAERQVACIRTPADLNPSRPLRFPHAMASAWLLGEAQGVEHIRNQVQRMRAKQFARKRGTGQATLQLVPPTPSDDPEDTP